MIDSICAHCGNAVSSYYGYCVKCHLVRRQERDKKFDEIIWAARTRLLTVEEMEILEKEKESIFVRDHIPYNDKELWDKLNTLLMQQFLFRLAKEKSRLI